MSTKKIAPAAIVAFKEALPNLYWYKAASITTGQGTMILIGRATEISLFTNGLSNVVGNMVMAKACRAIQDR